MIGRSASCSKLSLAPRRWRTLAKLSSFGGIRRVLLHFIKERALIKVSDPQTYRGFTLSMSADFKVSFSDGRTVRFAENFRDARFRIDLLLAEEAVASRNRAYCSNVTQGEITKRSTPGWFQSDGQGRLF